MKNFALLTLLVLTSTSALAWNISNGQLLSHKDNVKLGDKIKVNIINTSENKSIHQLDSAPLKREDYISNKIAATQVYLTDNKHAVVTGAVFINLANFTEQDQTYRVTTELCANSAHETLDCASFADEVKLHPNGLARLDSLPYFESQAKINADDLVGRISTTVENLNKQINVVASDHKSFT